MGRGNRVWCPKVLKKKKGLRSGALTGKKVFSSLSVSPKKISSQQNIWVFSSQGMSPSIIFSILMNQNPKEEGHIIIHVFIFTVVPDSSFFHFGCLLLPPQQRPKSCKALLPELRAGITNGINIYKIERHKKKKQQSKNSSHIRN